MSASDFEQVKNTFQKALDDWSHMQKTSGDEGAEWAERFEQHFYEMVEKLKFWYEQLEPKPPSYDELEAMPEIEEIQEQLPGPLLLNFLTELEDIYDGVEKKSFD
ncbi:hypothetical protein ACSVDE_06520 [Pseudalkalibacillus sp. Hm43]|uniref:hypothetical protein n=1 Tax=Pseudalkalibacillus sp. Hm43 TaxID=3450742 RepID=UPI003F4444E8